MEGGVGEVSLASVRDLAIAIVEARVAGHDAADAHDAARRPVGDRAGAAAGTAVHDVRLHVDACARADRRHGGRARSVGRDVERRLVGHIAHDVGDVLRDDVERDVAPVRHVGVGDGGVVGLGHVDPGVDAELIARVHVLVVRLVGGRIRTLVDRGRVGGRDVAGHLLELTGAPPQKGCGHHGHGEMKAFVRVLKERHDDVLLSFCSDPETMLCSLPLQTGRRDS